MGSRALKAFEESQSQNLSGGNQRKLQCALFEMDSSHVWQKGMGCGRVPRAQQAKGPRPSLFQQIVGPLLTSKGACALVGSPRLWLGWCTVAEL